MTESPSSPQGAQPLFERHRDALGAAMILLAIPAGWMPIGVFMALAALYAVLLALMVATARRMERAARTPMSVLGHIAAVVGGSLVCVFFMARYVHYIGFRTHMIASVLIILALAFLLLLRRPVHD